jgi:hypothetical protein
MMDFPDLLGGEQGEYTDTAEPIEGSVIDSIIREASQEKSEETATQTVSQKVESEDPPVSKKPKGKRVVYSVACTLHLSGSDYEVQLLPPSSGYDKAYRLNKKNAQKPTGYTVTQMDGGIICECHDFRFRQDGVDTKGCKHVRGLVDMGFFSAPPVSYRTGSGIFDG